jgi:hypothetical protein
MSIPTLWQSIAVSFGKASCLGKSSTQFSIAFIAFPFRVIQWPTKLQAEAPPPSWRT